jgi:murein DD-endopeptidase MepM/ murein hydrolase activator NlpD
LNSVRRILERAFPEQRELIVRSGDRVRYVRFGRPAQFICVAVLAGAVAGSAFATNRFLGHDAYVSALDVRIAELRDRNSSLEDNLEDVSGRLDAQRRSLSATERTAADLTSSNDALSAEITQLEARLSAERQRAGKLELAYLGELQARSIADNRADGLERSEQEISNQLAEREGRLAETVLERDRLNAEVARLENTVRDLNEEIGTLDYARTDLLARLNASEQQLRSAIEERLRVEDERTHLGAQVAELSSRLETIEDAQFEVVARLGEQADQSGEALRRTLDLAGLDVDRLLDRMARSDSGASGVGGPLVSIEDAPGSNLAQQIAAAERRVDDLASLQELMARLPLAAPLDEYRMTSSYGRRVDPFTKSLAFHSGMDMASRHRAPVHVTSPGVVTFVGWKGGFGKMVEVDHGLGVRTRYGHLSTIFVKRGQQLEFRERVGLVGNTGRSSGEHLHYEVIVDGRPNDPANFIKAGQYVFKK